MCTNAGEEHDETATVAIGTSCHARALVGGWAVVGPGVLRSGVTPTPVAVDVLVAALRDPIVAGLDEGSRLVRSGLRSELLVPSVARRGVTRALMPVLARGVHLCDPETYADRELARSAAIAAAEVVASWTERLEAWLGSGGRQVVASDGSLIDGRASWAWARSDGAFDSGRVEEPDVKRAEAVAALEALEACEPGRAVALLTDWEHLESYLRAGAPADIVARFERACESRDVRVLWVPSHSGHAGNEAADRLAKVAASKK